MFIDEIKVYARAGHGGKGCVAFQREKYCPKGGPSGGNGGRGGDVILEADHDLNNLIAQYFQPRLIAPNGEHGLGKGMDGHAGKDLIIKVPCGTLVWKLPSKPAPEEDVEDDENPLTKGRRGGELQTGGLRRPTLRTSHTDRAFEVDLSSATEEGTPEELPLERELVADLVTHGQRHILCGAGRGGLGNRNFATSTRQAPRFAQPGEPGAEGEYLFELRILAEVGLVGYPNAGKSTLLTAISKARPKVAPYPFTTLHPQIGILEYSDWRRLTVCDVPGLIDGAHLNVGLGHAFLRHIQRCTIIVLLIDMAGTDNRAPWDDYKGLLKELELYNPELVKKPRIVVANKMDEAISAENLKKFKRRITKTPVLTMSAAFGEGVDRFKLAIRKAVEASTVSNQNPQGV
ncbi:MAG: GTPase ObgE [Verrucomicrobia bacterium]|jgi:GTP-binding protein|nr:GTPase ObgE [Verrucomicrobiota bacterium]